MPTLFREGERVIVDFGIGDPRSGEIIAASDDGKLVTVRLDASVMGYGDLPFAWRNGAEYGLLAGGSAFLRKSI